ncbi:hypothetical protein GHT09_013539 [Marmota monax]|uniref:long-chain-fatty-acid--CoA ligase n=1 Tax=Marmota monax TaxID=9995 RepID=A0A834UZ44_MARMO|nr:hypothetical protein GHT09_013539 [Marmota monax]
MSLAPRKRDLPLGYHVAKALVYSRVRRSLGLEHCHAFLSGAAPLTESTSEFFLSLDIPIGENYGLSESSGPHSISTHSDYRILSCGKIVSGCENMLVQQNKDGTGEVCMWGRHIFMGYLDREDTTLETIDEDGWLHSGDLGCMDNQGFLFITGRIKEILITAGGENVAPVPIENLVREKIPIISNAMLVGDRAKFLSILLTLKCETDQVSGAPLNKLSLEAINFCRSLGSQADTVTEIVRQQDPLIYEAIQQGIDAVNLEATSEAQRIHKWVILEKDFSIQGGELGVWSLLHSWSVSGQPHSASSASCKEEVCDPRAQDGIFLKPPRSLACLERASGHVLGPPLHHVSPMGILGSASRERAFSCPQAT